MSVHVKKNIILAEARQVVRDGLKLLLETSNSYKVTFGALNGQQVIDALEAGIQADLIISDIAMPVMDGITLINILKERQIQVPVLIVTMLEDIPHLYRAISAGASGFLTKDVEFDELLFAVSRIIPGGRYVCSALSMQILDRAAASMQIAGQGIGAELFSPREIEVLDLISQGLTNSEIGGKLYLSKRTVEGLRQHLMEKTGSVNTATLICFAFRNKLIR